MNRHIQNFLSDPFWHFEFGAQLPNDFPQVAAMKAISRYRWVPDMDAVIVVISGRAIPTRVWVFPWERRHQIGRLNYRNAEEFVSFWKRRIRRDNILHACFLSLLTPDQICVLASLAPQMFSFQELQEIEQALQGKGWQAEEIRFPVRYERLIREETFSRAV